MKIVSANQITDRIMNLHKFGNYPGVSTGWGNLDKHYTVRKGNTTIITGYPTSGKTSFYLNLLMNLTKKFGQRHLIYSPETGTAEEIYSELIFMYTGKTFNKLHGNAINEGEVYNALPFIQDYFKVIEPEEHENTPDAFYEVCKEGFKDFQISSFGIDNWNDLEHDVRTRGGSISEYLKYEIPRFNRFAKQNDCHGFLLAHPRNPDAGTPNPIPPPRPDQIEGGSLWYAKAQSMLIVHRNWDDPNDYTTLVKVEKAKPKIVGKKGGFAELTYYAALGIYKNDTYKTIEDLKPTETPF